MNIYGLQKMTLLDYPGHVACTVFLSGCDFRCPFCHNFDLACGKSEPVMTDSELLSFLEKRTSLLDGVAFTGGEPLLSPALPELMRKIKKLGFKIKLDTNGYHPEKLAELIDEGLCDYVAMDIKNSPEKYALTCGVEKIDISKIEKSISILKESNIDFEFRTTVVNEFHSEEDFEKIADLISGAKKYYLQAFVGRDSVPTDSLSAPSKEKLEIYAEKARRGADFVDLRGVEK